MLSFLGMRKSQSVPQFPIDPLSFPRFPSKFFLSYFYTLCLLFLLTQTIRLCSGFARKFALSAVTGSSVDRCSRVSMTRVTVCHKYFCDVKTDDTQSILLSIFLQMREFLTMLLIFGVLQATTKTPRKTRRQETSAREEVPKRTQMSRIPPTSRKIRRS